mmetsp:Transcript_14649/g.34571  ORF Transcript_14649/g.34571 Transcript_14649/m.34571 type:complete len:126 (+) Transcript_14649:66-443(+)
MARCLLFVAAFFVGAEAIALQTSSNTTRFTINDIVKINGKIIGEGDSISVGCAVAPEDAGSITVCGSGVQVVANLLNRCKEYQGYTETVGDCDDKKTGCITKELKAGYSDDQFTWHALSYEIKSC